MKNELINLGVKIIPIQMLTTNSFMTCGPSAFLEYIKVEGIKAVFTEDLSDIRTNNNTGRIDRQAYYVSVGGMLLKTVVNYE